MLPGSPLPASAYDPYSVNEPSDPRLPGSGGQLTNLYDLEPQFFGKTGSVVEKASKFGSESDVYTGIDATVTRGTTAFSSPVASLLVTR